MRRKFESAFNKNGVEAKSPKIRSIVDFIVNTLKKTSRIGDSRGFCC